LVNVQEDKLAIVSNNEEFIKVMKTEIEDFLKVGMNSLTLTKLE